MVATGSPLLTRKDLMINPRKLGVVQWPYTVPVINTVKDPVTGGLLLPDNGYVVGAHRKQRGGSLANAQTYNDIMIHGSGNPAMKIPTERRISLGVEPVETNKQNLQNWLGADLSGVSADAAGGIHMDVPSLPINMLSRVAFVGRHDYNGLPVWICWVANRVGVTETQEQSLTDAEVVSYPYTFDLQDVDELGGFPVFVEIFGPGWAAMNLVADSGFFPPITAVTVAPATAALTVAAGVGHDIQLSVTDSNLRDRTQGATYESWDTAKAVVSSHGVVSAVAATGANVPEVQTITITGTGTYVPSFDGVPALAGVAHNAASATVQTALQGITSLGSGNVTVAGSAGGPYTCTFAGAYVNMNVPQLTINNAGMTGGTANVVTTTQGAGTVRIKATVEGKVDDCVVTAT